MLEAEIDSGFDAFIFRQFHLLDKINIDLNPFFENILAA